MKTYLTSFCIIILFFEQSVRAEYEDYDRLLGNFMSAGSSDNTSDDVIDSTSDSLENIFTDNETIENTSSTSQVKNETFKATTDNIKIEMNTTSTQSSTKLTPTDVTHLNNATHEIESTIPSNITESTASTTSTENENVVLVGPTKSTISLTKDFFQKSLEFMNNTYTLSILLPITAGITFALTIIITFAFCNCIRRNCRRRRLRKKMLPNSVKELRPSDRARLLAESSDEEF